MSKPFVFEKPLGMRDTLPSEYRRKEQLSQKIKKLFIDWGYEYLETPTLEFYDTVGGVSSTLEQRLFKLLDRTGRTLVLRPDLTAPIARVVGSLLKEYPLPLRLAYYGNVFRAQEIEAGKNAEFTELGVELIGEEAPDADGEVIAMAIAALKNAHLVHFSFAIGHASLIRTLLHCLVEDDQKALLLMQSLQDKDVVGFRKEVEGVAQDNTRQALLGLLELKGQEDFFVKLDVYKAFANVAEYVVELQEIWSVLKDYGVTENVHFDLSLMKGMDYYTGIHFEGVAEGLGYPLCSGGRYDHLLEQFDRPAPAVGFSIKLDRVLQVSRLQESEQQELVLIAYDTEAREEAVAQASLLRQQGKRVMLKRVKHLEEANDWISFWKQEQPQLRVISLNGKEGVRNE